ncbi:hypothetical protein N9E11_02655 [Crocinitomicaceae bacterium]|nr:hypothetical protein [Crocinitomicaceae bacterium]
MGIKCSYCKSRLDREAEICGSCGSRQSSVGDTNSSADSKLSNETEKDNEILNLKMLNVFFRSIKDTDRNYKSSLNTGLFSKVMLKLEGVDYGRDKSSVIDNFDKKLDSKGLELVLDFIENEISNYKKSLSEKRWSFINPKSKIYLIDRKILNSWVLLLERYLKKKIDEKIDSKIQLVIKEIKQL